MLGLNVDVGLDVDRCIMLIRDEFLGEREVELTELATIIDQLDLLKSMKKMQRYNDIDAINFDIALYEFISTHKDAERLAAEYFTLRYAGSGAIISKRKIAEQLGWIDQVMALIDK